MTHSSGDLLKIMHGMEAEVNATGENGIAHVTLQSVGIFFPQAIDLVKEQGFSVADAKKTFNSLKAMRWPSFSNDSAGHALWEQAALECLAEQRRLDAGEGEDEQPEEPAAPATSSRRIRR